MRYLFLCTLLGLVVVSCNPGKKTAEETADREWALSASTYGHGMKLSWKQYRGGLITGYNIYISPVPLAREYPGKKFPASIKPVNAVPFPGDTNPDDGIEYFEAEHLENGVKYYVSVRVVFPDRTLSPPSNEVVVVCNPKGEIELSVRFQSEHDGYSFAKDKYVHADALENDIFFFTKDGHDYLGSPSRLGGFLRSTALTVLNEKGDYEQVRVRARQLGKLVSSDRAIVKTGDWLLARLSGDSYALLRVLGFEGAGTKRQMRLFFSYSDRTDGELFF